MHSTFPPRSCRPISVANQGRKLALDPACRFERARWVETRFLPGTRGRPRGVTRDAMAIRATEAHWASAGSDRSVKRCERERDRLILIHRSHDLRDDTNVGPLDRLWSAISDVLFGHARGEASEEETRQRAQGAAPVVWLLGKTGAGKTAIVAVLTGNPRAQVGQGFEPCTRTADFYDVPPEAPLLRFLDTRGLGEADYDPTNDIAWCEEQSHLLLVVMQVADPAQDSVLRVLREARRRHPAWPVVVAQTGLHRLYPPGMPHPDQYPFTSGGEADTNAPVPHALRRAIAYQRQLFAGLRGSPPYFVPLDFTMPEDEYPPLDFGLEPFWRVLETAGPQAFMALHRARADAESDVIRAKARPLIYGYAAAAAGAGAVPIPLVGVGGLGGVIALMLRTLAGRYGIAWTRSTFAQFTAAAGGGALLWWALRYGVREMLKVVPLVGTLAAGMLNAAAAFAVTVGVGEAVCVWLAYRRQGETAPDEEVRRAFARGLADGFLQAQRRSARKSGDHA
jgi:uncharacterized protein (DUF697 family)